MTRASPVLSLTMTRNSRQSSELWSSVGYEPTIVSRGRQHLSSATSSLLRRIS